MNKIKIKEMVNSEARRKLTGKNALVRDLFEYLFCRIALKDYLLMLCTKKGLILNCVSSDLQEELSGYSISPDFFNMYQEGLLFINNLEEYILVAAVSEEELPFVKQ